ncbi:peptidase T, putative [Entamoeba histolytica HM-1:IMSS-B]|uniref:Peptidase T, putative n=6 Tax=Entamoeba histolytica TaxID=5759 RepID=C4M2F1_ENTH1|nr:peptidase T, putative [Entamoeba histolytica HM-1:IMSS]EMD42615.1 peptidase T, putative [Entamoeba histolytica KU27]EMH73381.1 peptidase T, putative [Entamoeba histolytica HM-1:IMSS-B]EMS12332.1 peptidase T, putative [Entamoeba histolytica HM-3:IMSS]ENY59857.1 peptidase T, putative [Entamoeba histolytica HM-1:IMSS-A]GAT95453.1 peptidase t putative [Entamoeba histolytica]|eukprot:XP_650152.1 peptidase T, putative [Entamoeba histolytica HM-1:IMSS]
MTDSYAVQKFLKYVTINSQSNESTHVTPSTQCQFDMQKQLQKDLKELNVHFTFDEKNCILKAELPATNGSKKSIGFFAHIDTSPEASGEGVKPIIHQLPTEVTSDLALPSGTVISKDDIKKYGGDEIITSSGDTLLGADDKSGVAILMGTLNKIMKDNIPHPRIMVIFTPDEEIGESCDHVCIEDLHLDYAYSVDGDELGTYNDEGFNAFGAELTINGYEVHPGEAYNIMEDAGFILSQFYTSLPISKRPETTKEDEGYILCTEMSGSVIKAHARFIVRSFKINEMEFFIQLMKDQISFLKRRYTKSSFDLKFTEQYRNMKRYLPDTLLVDKLIEAMKLSGVEAKKQYMRGGADCSHLSEKGLPCINMFAGGMNFHSRREFVPVKAINKGVEVLGHLVQLF